MIPNIWYIVTKGSDDGEFEIGDRVKMDEDGFILCSQLGACIDSEDVVAATAGWQIQEQKTATMLNMDSGSMVTSFVNFEDFNV